MRAVVLQQHGGPEVLRLRELDTPRPGQGEALVEVEAAGVAFADVLMRKGIYPETPRLPFTPGYDVVGRVVSVGPGVRELAVGDRVAALVTTGGCATHALVTQDRAVVVPDAVDAAQLCALTLNYVSAHQMLHRVARVPPGATVLVLGAAGGVGTALLELAALAGIRAVGTASGDRTAAVRARGGIALDRRTCDVPAEVRRLAPDGVAAVFDPVGGPSLRVSQSLLARGGVLVSYGVSFAADDGSGRLAMLLRHGLALARAKVARSRTELYVIAGRRGRTTRRPDEFRADLAALVMVLARGGITPEVTTMRLAEAAQAHRALEDGAVTGKLVLVP